MLLIETFTHMQGFVLRCVSLASYWHQNVKQYKFFNSSVYMLFADV
jgi:hypothetical protein